MSQDPTLYISGTVLLTSLVGFGGYLIASKSRGREDERERKKIARAMKARVDEHYATYLDLEERVKLVIEQFDRVEEESLVQMSAKDERIVVLEREIEATLANTRTETHAQPEPQAEFAPERTAQFEEREAHFEERAAQFEEREAHFEEREAHFEEARISVEEARSEIAALQGEKASELAALRSEKASELEAQARRIEGLQIEIAALQDAHRAEIERVSKQAEEARKGSEQPAQTQAHREDVEELRRRADEIAALSGRVAELEPLQERLAASEARVQELIERCEAGETQVESERERHAKELRVREQCAAEAQEQAQASAQEALLAQQRSAAAQEEVSALRAGQAAGMEQFRSQQEVLQARVDELEPLSSEIVELREECTKLERNAKRHGSRARNLKAELTSREEEIRELGADPEELAAERKARLAELRECAKELEQLSQESDRHYEQLVRLESFNGERESQLEAEIASGTSTLAGLESGLSPLFETVDSLIDSLSEARTRITTLEAETAEAQLAHTQEQTSLIELLQVAEENMPSAAELEMHEEKMNALEDRYEGLLAEKELELSRLQDCVAELAPLKAAVEDLSNTLQEKSPQPAGRKKRR